MPAPRPIEPRSVRLLHAQLRRSTNNVGTHRQVGVVRASRRHSVPLPPLLCVASRGLCH